MQILEVVSYYLYEGHRCAGGRGRRQKSVLPVQAGDPGIILSPALTRTCVAFDMTIAECGMADCT